MSYRHLTVFSCLAYVYVEREKRGKLDPKFRLCIFLGYQLWNLAEKKVIRSRDIVFMQEKTIYHRL